MIRKRFSITVKIYALIVTAIAIVTILTATMTYYESVNQVDGYYKRLSLSVARHFSTTLDKNYLRRLKDSITTEEYKKIRDKAEAEDNEEAIQKYLMQHGLYDKFMLTQSSLMNYINSMDDVKYLYIIDIGDPEATKDMMIIDDDKGMLYRIGQYDDREPELYGIDKTKNIETTISDGDWGWLCSSYAPVYDEANNLICHVGCDIDMEDVIASRHELLLKTILTAVVLMLLSLLMSIYIINKILLKPISNLIRGIGEFQPSNPGVGITYLDLNGLNDNDDEISDIFRAVRNMQESIIDYINTIMEARQLNKQQQEQIEKVSEQATRDTLTHVGNKLAYTKKSDELNKQIRNDRKSTKFAIVIVDANDLKMINDTYGHKAGDTYIQGCCRVICEAYNHSPVFRIGGDEFVIVLTGEDYINRYKLLEQVKDTYDKMHNNTSVQPQERYSASIGMAEYASDDSEVELVFKRADRNMYKDKQEFKKKYGSYR